MSPEDCLQAKRGYYATVSFLDHQVGRVLGELDRLGLRDSTIVIFASDHGYMLGQHQGWQKTQLWEQSTRVPFIIDHPGLVRRDTAARGLAELVDLFPTVCDLAGITPPDGLDGRSLRPILDNPEKPFRDAVFAQVDRRNRRVWGRTIRTERWRYTEWQGEDAGIELYDHSVDPGEHTNLAHDPGHVGTVTKLRQQLEATVPRPQETPAVPQ
jgi:uncharacterized sulfatase